jgi:radical SAM protein with 4Fe4S-binding SPASM domain
MATWKVICRALGRVPGRLLRREAWRDGPLKWRIGCFGPERPRRFPVRVQIESTSKCNLRCATCPHAREAAGGRHLTVTALARMLDRLPRVPARVVLSGVGEPLVNPEFFALVDVLAARKILCEFYTNGTLLSAQTRREVLARAGVVGVTISCDGARRETFEAARVGASFDAWRERVGAFLGEVRRQRGGTLRVGFNTVLSQRNAGEVAQILQLALELGVDDVFLLDPVPVDDLVASLRPSDAVIDELRQASLLRAARARGLNVKCMFRTPGGPPQSLPRCLQPWQYIFLGADGKVLPCCALFDSQTMPVMGNLLDQDFAAIWHGPAYRRFRRTSAQGTNPCCTVCPYY